MSTSDYTPRSAKPLTGRKVLLMFVAFFGIIIAVNVFMAVRAVRTFPGLETDNSYVASQEFDVRREAQEALGWATAAEIRGTQLHLDIIGPDGRPAELRSVTGILGRATEAREDRTPDFTRQPSGTLVAEVGTLGYGYWNLRLEAVAEDGTEFRQRIRLFQTEQ